MIFRTVIAPAIALAASTLAALAHHPMGGTTPATFGQGFLSGLGHPVIGPDHLAAVIAVGALAALHRMGALLAIGYVAATLLGVAVHLQGVAVPAAEVLVAASVVVLGVVLLARAAWPPAAMLALFGAVGVLHGYALGESIVGAERTPLVAYLAGLALVQCAIAIAVMLATRAFVRPTQGARPLRIAGAGIAVVGLVVFVTQLAAGV